MSIVSLYEDYWHHVWPRQQWLWCIISHLLLLEVLISFGASAPWQNVQICDILQICFKKVLMILWILRPFFHMLAVNVCRQGSVPLGMLISLLVFCGILRRFFFGLRGCAETEARAGPVKTQKNGGGFTVDFMSQKTLGAANPSAAKCVAFQTFQDISITGSFPCRVCGHSIPGRDHHCVGHLGEYECQKVERYG